MASSPSVTPSSLSGTASPSVTESANPYFYTITVTQSISSTAFETITLDGGRESVNPIATNTTTSWAEVTVSQPTAHIPLTTTFTPPSSCTENRLSQMPPPGYMIWMNEPVPAPNITISDCFPREFLRDYQTVQSAVAGSSVVPAMSPLVCPIGYCTVYAGDDNYIACCPSGYQLHRPDTTILQDRPGYGGTCYSDFTMGKTVYVTAYNATGATNLAAWTASTSGAQAYAHVIDGFATQSPMLGCPRVRHLSAVSRCIALTSDPAANLSLRRPNLLKH